MADVLHDRSKEERMKLTAQNEADIRRVLDDYMRFWMAGQAQACAELYDVAGDLLAVDGTFLRGRGDIRKYYDSVMSGKYSGLQVRNLQSTGIRPLSQGVAMMDATWEVHNPSGDGSSSIVVASVACSLVVVQTDDAWKIAAARLMVPMTSSE
jgi:uncharacterized protein (TIGR02246 family)